jgi:hypothetical protein
MPTVTTLMNILTPIANALLPPIGKLLTAITPILQLIGDLLLPIVNFVGKIIEWVSGGIGKVADFFGGLFGGAKKSKGAVEELNTEVDDLAGKSVEPEITVDTSSADKALDDLGKKADAGSKATADAADKALRASTKEIEKSNKEIENSSEKLNKSVGDQLKAISNMSEDAYNAVGTHAEKAWLRAVEAARVGTEKIVGYIGNVNGLGTVSVSVSDPVPHHAKGTRNFPGGPTHVHEEGDEVIGLPGGSTILTKGQSDRLLDDAKEGARGGSRTIKKEVTHNIVVTVNGSGLDPEAQRRLTEEITASVRQQLQEDREDEEKFEIIQEGYAA